MTSDLPNLVESYIATFFGHGNLSSPLWFIGKEHGGDDTFESKILRFKAWKSLGEGYTVDAIDFSHAVKDEWQQKGKLQQTYDKIIQFILAYHGMSYGKEDRSAFIRKELGANSSNHCVLELMPLASKSQQDWIYAEHLPSIPYLNSRELYFSTVAPKRRDLLIQLIRQYQPKVVMFYSTSGEYIPHWEHIAGSKNWEDLVIRERFSAKIFSNESTTFLITPHPTRQGIRGDDFPELARTVKARIKHDYSS